MHIDLEGKLQNKKKYDLFFCLPNSFSSALIGFFTGSKNRVGYKSEFRSALFTHSYNEKMQLHRAEQYIDLISGYTGTIIKSAAIELKNSSSENVLLPAGKNLLLNINSEAQSRKMPIELAVKIITEINKKYNFNLLLTGSKKDVDYVKQLEIKLGSTTQVYNYAGKTSLADLLKLVSAVDFVISVDSGIAHVANAFSKNTIVLLGAGNEINTRPFNSTKLKMIRKPGLACAPCVSNTCKFGASICLTEMEPLLIVKALEELVENTN